MNASSMADGPISCHVHVARPFEGMYFGDSPFKFDTPLLLIQLSLCALVTAIVQRLLMPLGQSLFISQMIAGVILGPSVLGRSAIFRDTFFPVSSFYIVDTFAFFGVMFFLFIVGVKTDFSLLRKTGKKAVAIGLSAFLLPLLLNFMICTILVHAIPMESVLHKSITWIASSQALTSFHVIVCLLADIRLMNSEVGKLAISSSMISGICSWSFAVTVFSLKQASHAHKRNTFLLMLLFFVIMIIFAMLIFRPIILWMISCTTDAKSLRESHVCAIFILVLGSALFGEFFGQHYLFGPMILGMVIPDGPPLGSALVDKLESFISAIILPIFFVISGARIDFSSISLRNFAIIEFLALCALMLKVVGVMLPSLYCKMPGSDAFYLGLILGNQGITEVILLERAQSIELIDRQSCSIMALSIVLFTGILAPTVKFSYKPSRRYKAGERLTIQHANPYAELRILACVNYQEHTPSIINLFDATYPHCHGPICFCVVHLLELEGRSAPALVSHDTGIRDPSYSNESEHIINALRSFEHERRGTARVYPFTAISPYASIHYDVCTLAAEERVSIVILMFHKHPLVHVSEWETNSIRTVNNNIIRKAPCSVGILVDRGARNRSTPSNTDMYRIGVIFIGGPHDREALAYASHMVKHPSISLTLIRFVQNDTGHACLSDMEQDFNMIDKYREANLKNHQCLYQEESVIDSLELINVMRSVESNFELILVGRRHEHTSPLLAGLNDWNEFPELGCVGDMLVSLDSHSSVSVLVVQQASSEERVNEYIRQDSPAVVDVPWNDGRHHEPV